MSTMHRMMLVVFVGLFISISAASARADLLDGLLSYWKFDEGTGSKAYDSGPRGYDGQLAYPGTGVTWVSGAVGGAVRFAGDDLYRIDCGTASRNITTGLTGMTVAFWARTEDDSGDLISNGKIYNTKYGGTLGARFDGGSDNMFIGIGNPSGMIGENWVNAEWHYRTVTWGFPYGGTHARSYVDGDCKGTTSFSAGPLAASTNNLRFGMNPERTGYSYTGAVDEIAIWDRALTGAEVLEAYQLGRAGRSLDWTPPIPEPSALTLLAAALLACRRRRV